MKKNKKKLFTNIAIASALSFAVVGVGVATIYNNDYQVTKAVEYDDVNNEITLSVNELNNYHFENFYNIIVSLLTDNPTYNLGSFIDYLEYNDNSFSYDYQSDGSFYFVYNGIEYVYFVYDVVSFNNVYETDFDSNYCFYYDNGNGYIDFNNYLILHIVAEYQEIKSAIELDIQANGPRGMGGALQDFISILIGGIVRLANGVATGVADFAKALFLNVDSGGAVTGLSIFGGIVAIFSGLALAVGITTKVYSWITSLGN